jgi:type VI secretion system secreted protein VgrG
MADQTARTADTADFTFVVGDHGPEVLKVTAFMGDEGISRLFAFRLELCSDEANIDFASVLGKACCLEIAGRHGSRYVNGVVREFEQTGEGSNVAYYAAEIVPLHWFLTKRFKTRLFREHNCSDMSVPGIIKKVLEDAGIPEERFRFALEGTYEAREFVVQYRETDYNFIARLMEDEGIFFFFEHTAEGHTMVIGDGGVAHTETPNEAEFPFREPNALVAEKEFVFRARERQSLQFASICLDDFNFRQPTLALRSEAQSDTFTSLAFSDHPGGFEDESVGDRYARVRLEEHQCAKRIVSMSAAVRALIPGYTFKLTEHPREPLNIQYLVTRLEHQGSQPQSGQEEAVGAAGVTYQVDVRAIPADVPYRPARVTPQPQIVGTQTALVVGPEGEEIYTDDDGYGRVKVHFHWDLENDHDENASCWVRVSHGWAGGNYGMLFMPRVGQEVVVTFIEGDPDHPLIIGRVYNNDNMPPYKLPDEKTKSTIKSRSSKEGGGFNEFRFEDKKGDEQIFMHGEKDLDLRVKNDERDWIGRDKHEIIKRHQKKQIEGAEGRAVGGDQATSIGGDRTVKVKGGSLVQLGAEYTLEAGGDIVIGGPTFKLVAGGEGGIRASTLVLSASTITLKSGGNFVTIDGGGVHIVGSVVNINSGGSAASVGDSSVCDGAEPAQPDEAATGDPGEDYTYELERKQYDPLDDALTHDEEDESDERHWIGIRLYDDNGLPLAGERYLVVLPDGSTVAKGRTNRDGEAEVRGIDPGSCEVTFPDLDGMTWQPGPPPGGVAEAPAETGGI